MKTTPGSLRRRRSTHVGVEDRGDVDRVEVEPPVAELAARVHAALFTDDGLGRRTMPIVIVDLDRLARNWWLVVLRGIAGVVFALCTFLAPEISLAVLVLLFGAYTLVDGVFAIVSAFRGRGAGEPPWLWWMLLLEGVVDVGVGVITFVWPDITALALLYLIAAWAVLTGCLEIAAAIRLRKLIPYEWLLGLTGALSIGLGILLALFPGPGALALVFWVGAYALVTGGLLIALGLRLRSWNRILGVQATDAAA